MAQSPTNIPAVPVRTPMFDDNGNLTVSWIRFFESLAKSRVPQGGLAGQILSKRSDVDFDLGWADDQT